MKNKFFGILAVIEFVFMFYTQGLAERGIISPGRFVVSFLLQTAAFILCCWQAGVFDAPKEK